MTKKRISPTIAFLLVLALMFCLQLWKARRGMGSSDEHFYISLGWRLEQGDGLFADDWHIAQMISVFLYPLVHLYRLLFHSNTGIVLGFRVFYILFTSLVGAAVFFRYRSHGYRAVAAAALYMAFTPFNIQALSYNTMGPGFLILSFLLIDRQGKDRVRSILSGLVFSWAVLCTPYLALLYVGMIIVSLVRPYAVSRRCAGFFTLGVAIAAGLFLVFVFSRADLSSVVYGLRHLIDPSHTTSLAVQIYKNLGRLYYGFGPLVVPMPVCLILSVLFRKKGEAEKKKLLTVSFWFTVLSILWLLLISRYQLEVGGFTVILVPAAIFFLNKMILFGTSFDVSAAMFLSIAYSIALFLSSNVGPRSFAGPLIIGIAFSALDLKPDERADEVLYGLIIAVLILFKIINVYGGYSDFSVRIDEGPMAGLYDSSENVSGYEHRLSDIAFINRQTDCDYAYLITSNTWEYLALEKRIAANSTYMYFWEEDEYTACMDDYISSHPDRYPAYVYLDTENPYSMTSSDPWLSGGPVLKELSAGELRLQLSGVDNQSVVK